MKQPKIGHNFAEFIGIILGDGSIGVYGSQNRVKVSLKSIDELEYADYIKKKFIELFDIKPFIRFKRTERCVEILVFNKELLEFLTNKIGMKLAPKRDSAHIPSIFLTEDLAKYVLKGYFDSDGCVALVNNNGTLYPRLEMKVCESPMQTQFIEILRRMGFRFGAYKAGNGSVRIQMNGKKMLRKWVKEIGFSNHKNIERSIIAGAGFEPATYTQISKN